MTGRSSDDLYLFRGQRWSSDRLMIILRLSWTLLTRPLLTLNFKMLTTLLVLRWSCLQQCKVAPSFLGQVSGLESVWTLARLRSRWPSFPNIAILQLTSSMTIRPRFYVSNSLMFGSTAAVRIVCCSFPAVSSTTTFQCLVRPNWRRMLIHQRVRFWKFSCMDWTKREAFLRSLSGSRLPTWHETVGSREDCTAKQTGKNWTYLQSVRQY